MRFGQFATFKVKEAIDLENGVIRGVSVITEGEALGHDVWIDSKTLRQVKNTASTYAGGLKVKMNHYSGVESIAGVLRSFRIDGKQLRADLHLLKTSEQFDKIIEMAQTMPESFGLSIVFDNDPELIEKVNYARCKEIYSADLVDNPAANPSGLFSEKPRDNTMNKKMLEALGLPETATEADALAAIDKLGKAKFCGCGKKGCKDCAAYEKDKDGDGKMAEDVVASALSKVLGVDFKTQFESINKTVTELTAKTVNAEAMARKAEIDNLVAEASKSGKVIPLDTDDLYTVKDGVVTIKTDPSMLRKMLDKIKPEQVAFTRRTGTAPASKDGKPLTHDETIAFCQQKKEEGRQQLNAHFKSQLASQGFQN